LQRQLSGLPGAIAALAVAIVLTGCQQYQPQPLDAEAHRSAWSKRTAGDAPVRTFADRLAEARGEAASAFDPDDGLSMAEGELVALVYNPDLRLARLRAGVADASAAHAGLWDDPELAIDVLRITESVSSPWVITPGLSLTIPISGRLEAEKARASAALRAELDRVAEAEWQTRRDVRQAWLRWSAARLRTEQTQRFLSSSESLIDSTTQLAEAGEMPRTTATLFAIERLQRRHELNRLQGRVDELEQELRGLLGLSPTAPVRLQSSLDAGTGVSDAMGKNWAERSPELARLHDEYEVAEQSLRREVRKQYPDLTIGPLYESDQGQSRIGFLGALPIPILNANKQGIAEARAQRELARAEFETAYEQRAGSIAAVRARADALAEQRVVLTDELAPLVDRQLNDARRLLELGEASGLVLLESLVRAHDTKLQLIDVQLNEALAHVELRYLLGPTGAPVSAPTTRSAPTDNREVTE